MRVHISKLKKNCRVPFYCGCHSSFWWVTKFYL